MKEGPQRRIVHVSMAVFALFIGVIPPLFISLAAGLALLINLSILPRLSKRRLERDSQRHWGVDVGIILYPAGLVALSLIFFEQQIYMAIGWGAMAFGDSAAALLGSRLQGPKWPWNPPKHLSGSLAFFLIGTPLSLLLMYLLPDAVYLEVSLSQWAVIIAISVAVAALIETLPGLINDNLSVPFSAAFTAFFVKESIMGASYFFPSFVWLGLFLTLAFVVLSWGSGKIDGIGAITGGVLAFLIFLGGGFPAMGLLLVFFVLGTAVSVWKRRDKEALGLAQENEGKRSINNALANAGIAGLCGLLAWSFHADQEMFLMMLVASLAAATGDTFASELGNLYGKRYINILTFKADIRGRDGAISLEGSLAGLIGSFLIVLLYGLAVGEMSRGMWIAAIAGFLGVMVDSVLGASLQQRGLMTNDTVNFGMSLVGGADGGCRVYDIARFGDCQKKPC